MVRCLFSENKQLYILATEIAAYVNYHCHYDLKDMPFEFILNELGRSVQMFEKIAGR
jgi:hypothetical protein